MVEHPFGWIKKGKETTLESLFLSSLERQPCKSTVFSRIAFLVIKTTSPPALFCCAFLPTPLSHFCQTHPILEFPHSLSFSCQSFYENEVLLSISLRSVKSICSASSFQCVCNCSAPRTETLSCEHDVNRLFCSSHFSCTTTGMD